MKRRIVTRRKISKARLAWAVRRGKRAFRGAQSHRGSKDPKDLRGVKGLLLRAAVETDAQSDR